jgi:hypothetical protein
MTTKNNTKRDNPERAAAVALLTRGEATPAQVAELAGVSRQVVDYWARGIDWRKALNARLARSWRKALNS